jgi:NAD(P)-dependent dehydrogenase (short-subunit alcohol dehydrogenase family)
MSEEKIQQGAAKIAIVTGGSRGIGRNTVLSLAKRGVNTIFTYNTRKAEADALVAEVKALGTKAIAVQLDTGDVSAFDSFVQTVASAVKALGAERFDFLVNNAGNNHRNMPFAEATVEEMDSVYSQKLLPLINDGGHIVNVSTARTRLTSRGGAVYGSIKAAVETLTRFMAMELGPRRIRVNVVAPGAVETDFSGGIVRDNPEVNKMVADHTALGRAGLPEDIGPMIASLLSEENHWVNAQRIEVSGGLFL